MTRNSFIFKYLGYALAPHLLAIGLVLQLTVSSWQMDGQAFANWPAPLLYKTMAVLFVLLNAILWTFWGGYKVACERGVQQYQPALVPLNLAALAFSLGGHLYLTELLAEFCPLDRARPCGPVPPPPGAAKSETTASFS